MTTRILEVTFCRPVGVPKDPQGSRSWMQHGLHGILLSEDDKGIYIRREGDTAFIFVPWFNVQFVKREDVVAEKIAEKPVAKDAATRASA